MLPERLEFSSVSTIRLLRFPISVGIGPEKNEFKMINSSKFVRLPIQEFVVREKSPCERVKKIKFLRSPIHEKHDSFCKTNRERSNISKESRVLNEEENSFEITPASIPRNCKDLR